MSNWTEEQDKLEIFYKGAMSALHRNRKMSELITDHHADIVIIALKEWADKSDMSTMEKLETFSGTGTAISAFQQWSMKWKGYIPRFTRITLDRIGLEFNVPMGNKASVTFKADAQINYDPDYYSQSALEQDYMELWSILASAYIGFCKNPPKLAVAASNISAPSDEEATDQNTVIQSITHILYEIKSDKTGKPKNYYKLFTPMYHKFGVICWDEVLTQAGVPLGKLKVGKTAWKEGWKAAILAPDPDKPKKVLYLIDNHGVKHAG
jgi:hypothetical protein